MLTVLTQNLANSVGYRNDLGPIDGVKPQELNRGICGGRNIRSGSRAEPRRKTVCAARNAAAPVITVDMNARKLPAGREESSSSPQTVRRASQAVA